MTTWKELQEFARSKYKLSTDEDNLFGLLWSYEENRTQAIHVSRFDAFDQEWIKFRTYVCSEGDLAPRAALVKNDRFALGALGIDSDGDYSLSHSAPLASMDLAEFELPLTVLATTADELEKDLTGKDAF